MFSVQCSVFRKIQNAINACLVFRLVGMFVALMTAVLMAMADEPPAWLPQGPAPRADAWQILGMGGGGTTRLVRICPDDPELILTQSDMTCAFVSANGGRSFRMFNLLDGVNALAFDGTALLAGNQALWFADTPEGPWRMLFPHPATVTAMSWVTDDAECHLAVNDPLYPGSWKRIQAIAVDPRDNHIAYIAWNGSPVTIVRTRDRFQNWEAVAPLPEGEIIGFFHTPVIPGLEQKQRELPQEQAAEIDRLNRMAQDVIAVTTAGVYHLAGNAWTALYLPDKLAIGAACLGRDKDTQDVLLYAVSAPPADTLPAVFVSRDLGRTWRQGETGFAAADRAWYRGDEWRYRPRFRAIACSRDNAMIAYVGFQGLVDKAGRHLSGIARTANGGETWQFVMVEDGRPAPNMGTSYVEQRAPDSYPNVWFDDPYSLDVSAADGTVCFASDLFRVYATHNGGSTWQQFNSVPHGENRYQTNGIDVTNCYGVHWDPHDRQHMFIAYTDMGLRQSHDGGVSWEDSTAGMPNAWRNTTYWIVCDPDTPGLMWAACSAAHDLPRPRMFRKRDTDTYEGGVCTSADGGRTWKVTSEGLPLMAVTHILLDPESRPGRRTLYACGFGRGVYRSDDSGTTWTRKNQGIEGPKPLCWRLTRDTTGSLYLVVSRRSEKGEIGDKNDGALYRSIDGGDEWVPLKLPHNTNGPTDLAVEPGNDSRLYLAMWGRYRSDGDIGGGIFMSDDAGYTWEQVFDGDQHIYSVTVDPENVNTVYAAGFESSVYRSTDRGRTWNRLRGFNFKSAHRVFPDPADRDKIYVTTFGGSLWHGPAAGDPDAAEDIADPLPGKLGAIKEKE